MAAIGRNNRTRPNTKPNAAYGRDGDDVLTVDNEHADALVYADMPSGPEKGTRGGVGGGSVYDAASTVASYADVELATSSAGAGAGADATRMQVRNDPDAEIVRGEDAGNTYDMPAPGRVRGNTLVQQANVVYAVPGMEAAAEGDVVYSAASAATVYGKEDGQTAAALYSVINLDGKKEERKKTAAAAAANRKDNTEAGFESEL